MLKEPNLKKTKQRHAPSLLALVGIGLMLSSPGSAETKTTWHRNVDPAGYRTYDWSVEAGEKKPPVEALWPGFDTTLRRVVESRLAAMGYTKSPAGTEPDFRVQFDASTEDDYIRDLPRGAIPFDEDYWMPRGYETLRESYSKGTLILTIRDGATDQPVWCGWTTERFKRRKMERQTKKWVRRILGRFPPDVGDELEHEDQR